jgi:hypothetical protein
VLQVIRAGKHPHRDDLRAALKPVPGEPLPDAISEYCGRVLTFPERTRTVEKLGHPLRALIPLYLRLEESDLRQEHDSRQVRTRAKIRVARMFGVSVRTVERYSKFHTR